MLTNTPAKANLIFTSAFCFTAF